MSQKDYDIETRYEIIIHKENFVFDKGNLVINFVEGFPLDNIEQIRIIVKRNIK